MPDACSLLSVLIGTMESTVSAALIIIVIVIMILFTIVIVL